MFLSASCWRVVVASTVLRQGTWGMAVGSKMLPAAASEPRWRLQRSRDGHHRLPNPSSSTLLRSFSSSSDKKRIDDDDDLNGLKRMEGESLAKYFKRLTKDYWYVLIPEHLVTSTVWMGTFYLMVKSGVDIAGVLESMGTSHEKVERIGESPWAHLLLAYACYKIATPARYTVTVAGTTLSVGRLRDRGYLRTTREVKDSIRHKTDEYKDKVEEEWEKGWRRFAGKRDKEA